MKKCISCLLVVLMIFNFIFCNGVYAEPAGGAQDGE